ncbi:transposable element Tc1 transposase [Trichonephila clavipes]|nr:transposable element Tc1 transposase [Trichonephila clavipes]
MWAAEWNEVVFTDESHICLQHHDGWIRVWRHRGERMFNSCIVHRHTGPAPGIMVWGAVLWHDFIFRLKLLISLALNNDQIMRSALELVSDFPLKSLPPRPAYLKLLEGTKHVQKFP